MSIGLGFWFVCDFKVLFGTSRCVVISVGLVHLRRLKGRPDFFLGRPRGPVWSFWANNGFVAKNRAILWHKPIVRSKRPYRSSGAAQKKIRAPLTTHLEVPNKTLKILSNAYFIFILLCYFNKDLYTIGLLRYPWRGQLAKRPMGWQLLMTTAMSDWVSAEEKVSCVNFASGHCYLNS